MAKLAEEMNPGGSRYLLLLSCPSGLSPSQVSVDLLNSHDRIPHPDPDLEDSIAQIGGEVERESVERAVKRLIVEEEGASMRERALDLKEKLKASVRSGGSSYNALDELVKYLNTK